MQGEIERSEMAPWNSAHFRDMPGPRSAKARAPRVARSEPSRSARFPSSGPTGRSGERPSKDGLWSPFPRKGGRGFRRNQLPRNRSMTHRSIFLCGAARRARNRKSREISLKTSNLLEIPCGISIEKTATKSRMRIATYGQRSCSATPKPSASYRGAVFISWICEAKSGLCVELPDILVKDGLSPHIVLSDGRAAFHRPRPSGIGGG